MKALCPEHGSAPSSFILHASSFGFYLLITHASGALNQSGHGRPCRFPVCGAFQIPAPMRQPIKKSLLNLSFTPFDELT
jgi:hypothetical protein